MSPCVCFGGCKETVTYTGGTAAFQSQPDGSEMVLCKWCEGLISRTPTNRLRAYREGRLLWQRWPDRAHVVQEPDNFATAISSALPRLSFNQLDDDEQSGTTLVSEASAMLLNDGGFGTGAEAACQN